MSFTNVQVDLDALPRYDTVEFRRVDPRYAPIVLGLAVSFETVMLLVVAGILLTIPEPRALLTSARGALVVAGALSLAALVAWFAHKSASVIRYAVREHDVIVRKGVFFKRETIQPIRRIQHVEQLQGPVARRFGLYSIRLFSAGTAHFAFEIPGLGAETAARLRQAILKLRESKLAASASPEARHEAQAAIDETAPRRTDV